ncbi:NEDD8-activating enzyme E1 regulatory subunit-like [Xenia sp. Carnegie-2017]|uniref:NEDD8-activating enzyme E1 regulatory subunit-like n=1 Tax=Xenia sp. Carnegie-2017 TaxID=2897299 RepID=UPI001F03C3CF|nr:NEDD8-activating enzyme E1 regulatory subunit-like [Xenia sp. Carnegie-2017]
MTADTTRFMELQNCYHEKSLEDIEKITEKVRLILKSLHKKQNFIKDEDIRLFCKNSAFLRVVRCTSLQEEFNNISTQFLERLRNEDENDVMYILFRAISKFRSKHDRYPGSSEEHVKSDCEKLQSYVGGLMEQWELNGEIKEDYVQEICRFGGSQLHPVASFMGGSAAHEVIKIITNQTKWWISFGDICGRRGFRYVGEGKRSSRG